VGYLLCRLLDVVGMQVDEAAACCFQPARSTHVDL